MFVAGTNPILLGLFRFGGWAAFSLSPRKCRSAWVGCPLFSIRERFKEDAGLQQMQALIAWGSGGIEGLGLGNGRQKMLYLPYAHTDFIFPMIGEELGLRISLLVVFLFVVIIVCGMMIALARQRSLRTAPRLRNCLAARIAGGRQHRSDHLAPAEQRFAAAVCQLRRIESGGVFVWRSDCS